MHVISRCIFLLQPKLSVKGWLINTVRLPTEVKNFFRFCKNPKIRLLTQHYQTQTNRVAENTGTLSAAATDEDLMVLLRATGSLGGRAEKSHRQNRDAEQMKLEMPKQTALFVEQEDRIVLEEERTVRAKASRRGGLERIWRKRRKCYG